MKKRLIAVVLTVAMAMSETMFAMAGNWQKDGEQFRYQNDNGTYPTNTWQWIDGNNDGVAECYYFDGNGYMLSNTTTPDGYTVDANGAWVVNGVIQTQGTNVASTTTGRYIESDALPNIIMPENGLQGTYHLQRDVYENFKTGSASAGTKK